jgi:hypothetical protein
MDFTQLTVPSANPARLATFYRELLQLPVTTVTDGFNVTVGRTHLHVTGGPDTGRSHHFAFTIATARFASAKAWLTSRTPLLARDGQDEFHFDAPFGPADSVYFSDPDGSVLELIARDSAPNTDGGGFQPARDIVGLGEVAVPVASVPVAVEQLNRRWGLEAILSGPDFAAVGDHRGMFILATPNRPWLPTTDRLPNPTPLQVEATFERDVAPFEFSNHTTATST